MKPSIGVIGAGYVGLVTAVCYASKGFKVFLYEKDAKKRDFLKIGKAPFFETGLSEILSKVLNQNLFILEKFEDFFLAENIELIFSCVPTPASEVDGSCDLSFVFEVCSELVNHTNKSLVLINKSTIPPGTCANLQTRLQHPKYKLTLIHNPEFLRQGQAIEDFLFPDRIVFGSEKNNFSSEIRNLLLDLGQAFAEPEKILFTDFVTAELIKYGANVMLACRISMINQIFRLAKNLGADMPTVKQGIGMDNRIGLHYLQEGPGFGGSCLPKDLKALIFCAKNVGVESCMLEAIEKINESQAQWFFEEWKKSLPVQELSCCSITVEGVTFKVGTSDLRNSIKFELIKKIAAESPGALKIEDPFLSENEISEIYKELGMSADICEDKKLHKAMLKL